MGIKGLLKELPGGDASEFQSGKYDFSKLEIFAIALGVSVPAVDALFAKKENNEPAVGVGFGAPVAVRWSRRPYLENGGSGDDARRPRGPSSFFANPKRKDKGPLSLAPAGSGKFSGVRGRKSRRPTTRWHSSPLLFS